MRKRLELMRAELASAAVNGAEAARPVTLDQSKVGRLSRMDALQSQAMAQASQSRRALRIKQIDAALKRLDDDAYGDCLGCGDVISSERLNADPVVTLCIQCATRAEENS